MEEALIKRVLPHSIEAEQSVVGAMLMDKEAIMTRRHTRSSVEKIFTRLLTASCSERSWSSIMKASRWI